MDRKYIIRRTILGILLSFIFVINDSIYAQLKSFYVSPFGDDSNAGTIENPFATLDQARKMVSMGEPGNYVILLRGGAYYFKQQTLFCNLRDKKITIKPYQNERVKFSGGINLDVASFRKVLDPHIITRLRPEARDNVFVYDLDSAKISYDKSLEQSGFGHKIKPTACMLYFNDDLLSLARWPNVGKLSIGKVLDSGSKPRWEKPPYRGAVFKYSYDRVENWTYAKDIWIYGVFSNGFSDDNLKIESINLKEKTIKTVQPHTYGVFSNKDKSTWDLAHARQLRGYYVYNLLEEIDMPGEYFIDRNEGKLYLWPPGEMAYANIKLSIFTSPFLVFYNVSDVTVKGIDFECSRGLGIFMDVVSDIMIKDCSFSNLGLLGISVGEGYSSVSLPSIKDRIVNPEMQARNIVVESCKFFKTGTGGIFLTGGDRINLIPGNNSINNCEFYDYSKIRKTGVAAIYLKGAGNNVSHCFIHDAPHMAIHFSGNNHRIEYNYISNVCSDISDAGAIYIGRDPSAQGTSIRYNFFDSIIQDKNLVCAVYLDDGTCGINITDNIFYNCGNPEKTGTGFGAFHINGGYENYMGNNIFIKCKRAYGSSPWSDKKWTEFLTSGTIQRRLSKVNIQSKVYQESYPMLRHLLDSLNLPLRLNYTSNDLLFQCKKYTSGSYRNAEFWMTNLDPGFENVKNKKFSLENSVEINHKLPDFKGVPFNKIGLIGKSIDAP